MALIVAILEPGYADYSIERKTLEPYNATIVPVPANANAANALKELNPVAVMVRERNVSAAEFRSSPNLKVIVRYGVGVDNIDQKIASDRNIYVANVPDYGAEHEVSDQALALYLAVQRRVISRDAEVRAGKWGIGQAAPIPGRLGATLGLIGYGRIGHQAALKFKAFGIARVLVVDPNITRPELSSQGFEKTDLDTLCKEADVISLHAPLLPETHHIIDAARLALMKPTTILVNVSRGGLVDEHALAEALHAGRIFGAGIDVFEQEPIEKTNPLLSTPNTALSDHTAWYSERSVAILQTRAAEEIARVLQGFPPKNWINRWN